MSDEQSPSVDDELLDEIWDEGEIEETQADVDACTIEPHIAEIMDRKPQS